MQTLYERPPDVSVIIPVYNLEQFLDPMLRSLKEQKLGDYTAEYIFILNNCTDNSEDVIRESGLDCIIKYCEIQGCGPARNVGLHIAKGTYIWMMDGDDWLTSETAICDALEKAYAEDLDILLIPFESNLYRKNYFAMVWQYLLKREFIEEFRFLNIQPAEDDDYMFRVLQKAGKYNLTYLLLPQMPYPLYHYNYMREGSNMYRYLSGEKI